MCNAAVVVVEVVLADFLDVVTVMELKMGREAFLSSVSGI